MENLKIELGIKPKTKGKDWGIPQEKSAEFLKRKKEVTQRIFDLFRTGKTPDTIKIDHLPGILGIEELKPIEQKEKESDSDFAKRTQAKRTEFNNKLRAEMIKLFPGNTYKSAIQYWYEIYLEDTSKKDLDNL
jgi:hypothetical protein